MALGTLGSLGYFAAVVVAVFIVAASSPSIAETRDPPAGLEEP